MRAGTIVNIGPRPLEVTGDDGTIHKLATGQRVDVDDLDARDLGRYAYLKPASAAPEVTPAEDPPARQTAAQKRAAAKAAAAADAGEPATTTATPDQEH